MMVCHSWYLSPELAALALFSPLVTVSQKKALIENMTSKRGTYLLKILPNTVEELKVSSSLFSILGIDDILQIPVEDWEKNARYELAQNLISNIPCVNDCAERGADYTVRLALLCTLPIPWIIVKN